MYFFKLSLGSLSSSGLIDSTTASNIHHSVSEHSKYSNNYNDRKEAWNISMIIRIKHHYKVEWSSIFTVNSVIM